MSQNNESQIGRKIVEEEAMMTSCYYWMLGGNPDTFDIKTIDRVRGYCSELNQKRKYDKFTTFESDADEMVIGNHLKLFSICEHHLLPFFGEVSIGYIPQGRVLGLSKFQRIVDKCASAPHIQERLTQEILKFLIETLGNPKGAGVVVRAIHTCVFARGVQSASAEFTTTALGGVFKTQPETRAEFLKSIDGNRFRI
jgi:GTP cyclohydrolase I